MATVATVSGDPLDLSYTPAQMEIFWDNTARYTVVPKGRRLGATHGAANFVIESMLSEEPIKVLWVDTIHRNIDTYVERYFKPTLKKLKPEMWSWRQQAKELNILNSVCDFRSADRPDNIEGFAYNIIIMNEAGIILNNRYLWQTTVRPMCLDYHARVWFLGTPKGKTSKKDGKEHEYYTIYKKAQMEQEGKWKALHYTTYDNPLLYEEDIKEVEEDVPAPIRRQEILGEFIDIGEEEVFHYTWFARCPMPNAATALKIVQSWDTAYSEKTSNDLSACTTWFMYPDRFVCVDTWTGHVAFPDLLVEMKSQAATWQPHVVLIENKASGQSLIQTIQRETTIPVYSINVSGNKYVSRDKYTRACDVSNTIQAGKVYVVEGDAGTALINEMCEFPGSTHDDLTDTAVQFLGWARNQTYKNTPMVHRKVIRKSKTLKGY